MTFMIRIFPLVIIIALVLSFSACIKDNNNSNIKISDTSALPDTSKISTTININEPATEISINYEYETDQDLKNIMDSFFNALINNDQKTLEEITTACPGAYSFLNGMKISNYSYSNVSYSNCCINADVLLDVTESNNERLPQGKQLYKFSVGYGASSLDFEFYPYSTVNPDVTYSGDSEIHFCNETYTYFPNFCGCDSDEDFTSAFTNSYDESGLNLCILSRLLSYTQNPIDDENNTINEYGAKLGNYLWYDEYAKKCFGIIGLDFKNCSYYNADTGNIEIPAHGGSWVYGYINSSEHTEDDCTQNTLRIVITYCADATVLCPVKKIEFIVVTNPDGSLKMKSIKLLEENPLLEILRGSI